MLDNYKNILVIGGSGFIGSHTADMLSDEGYNVTIFDQIPSPWLKNNQKMIIGNLQNFDDLCNYLINSVFFFNMLIAYFKTPSISKFEESIRNASFVLINGEFFLNLSCLSLSIMFSSIFG